MNLRTIAAIGLIYVAFAGLPQGGGSPQPDTTPDRPVPSPAMQSQVEPVAKALKGAAYYDRAIFASVWEQAAKIVDGEDDDIEVTFDSTLGMRLWTVGIIDAAWRRIAGASGKYPGLGDAVEEVFADLLGNDVRAVDETLLREYSELCRALAWAGMPNDE
jgi:hypothetical protein